MGSTCASRARDATPLLAALTAGLEEVTERAEAGGLLLAGGRWLPGLPLFPGLPGLPGFAGLPRLAGVARLALPGLPLFSRFPGWRLLRRLAGVPRACLGHGERDAAFHGIDVEHPHLDVLADLRRLPRVVQAPPRAELA